MYPVGHKIENPALRHIAASLSTSLDRVGTMRLNQKQKKRMMFDDIIEIPKEKYGDAFSLRKFTHDELSMKPYIYLPHTITSIDGKQDLPFM